MAFFVIFSGCAPSDESAVNGNAPSAAGAPLAGAASRYPIVLVHGMAGYDHILGYTYFFGIEADLRALGFEVHTVRMDSFGSIEKRAAELKAQVLPLGKVNLIAHSQGAVDSRYMISVLGMAAQVASLTSISGPHHGTPLADLALGLLPGDSSHAADVLLTQLHLEASELEEMSERYMDTVFNPRVIDDPSIYYQSFAGSADPFGRNTGAAISPLLIPTWLILHQSGAAASDGVVPVESAHHGQFRRTIPADHFTEVGQVAGFTPDFDYKVFYEEVAFGLVDAGF